MITRALRCSLWKSRGGSGAAGGGLGRREWLSRLTQAPAVLVGAYDGIAGQLSLPPSLPPSPSLPPPPPPSPKITWCSMRTMSVLSLHTTRPSWLHTGRITGRNGPGSQPKVNGVLGCAGERRARVPVFACACSALPLLPLQPCVQPCNIYTYSPHPHRPCTPVPQCRHRDPPSHLHARRHLPARARARLCA